MMQSASRPGYPLGGYTPDRPWVIDREVTTRFEERFRKYSTLWQLGPAGIADKVARQKSFEQTLAAVMGAHACGAGLNYRELDELVDVLE